MYMTLNDGECQDRLYLKQRLYYSELEKTVVALLGGRGIPFTDVSG